LSLTAFEWTIFVSLVALVISISTMSYLMLVRIRQLTNELKRLNTKIDITDDELARLCDDIEGCKKIIV
jgi:cell division protein FtsL